MFFNFLELKGVFFEFDFWFLKILKLYFESELPLLGGLFYETFLFEASLSTSDDFIDSSGIIFLVPFLATKETLAPLANDPIM